MAEDETAEAPNLFLRAYSVFERGISALILVGMIVVICLATWSFVRLTFEVALNTGATLDYAIFQLLFDRVLAAVIAVELAHSIRQMVLGKHGMAQLRTVVVIGMLAVVRKIITVEVDQTTGLFLIGIASAVTWSRWASALRAGDALTVRRDADGPVTLALPGERRHSYRRSPPQ